MMRAWAPGRVNLIGEHTDYTGGLVLPMAIDLGTSITFERRVGQVRLRSDAVPGEVRFDLPVKDPASVEPVWGRYVAAVASELDHPQGVDGTVSSTVPVGSGLSSSAALEVAAALALGSTDPPPALAARCQRAEQRATGVPCGVMDQLASAAGVEGHALLIDCHDLSLRPVPMPPDAAVVVLHSGQARTLAGSAYAERRAQCEAAEEAIGPLRSASVADVDRISDPLARRRARHVVGENARVRAFAEALASGDLGGAGQLMAESHASLRDDFEVSTPALDQLVDRLLGTDGVYGARLTGAGFGGCVVALCRPGMVPAGPAGVWPVRASAGARLTSV